MIHDEVYDRNEPISALATSDGSLSIAHRTEMLYVYAPLALSPKSTRKQFYYWLQLAAATIDLPRRATVSGRGARPRAPSRRDRAAKTAR